MTIDEREPQREQVRAILRQSHICELRALAARTVATMRLDGVRGVALALRASEMSPADQARFRTFVASFVNDCGIEPPFLVVLTGSNGSVRVARYFSAEDVEPVCEHMVDEAFVSPIIVTAISADGTGRSAKIEIEQAGRTLQ